MKIDWIFFDIGGVLADESKFLEIRKNYNLEAVKKFQPETTKEDILAVWKEASAMPGDLDKNVVTLTIEDKSKTKEVVELMQIKRSQAPRYYDLLKIREETLEIVPKLAEKYKLGIMANQGVMVKNNTKQIIKIISLVLLDIFKFFS